MGTKKKRLIHFLAPAAISSLILYVLFSSVEGEAVLRSLGQSDKTLLLAAAIISVLINIFLGAEKWRRILKALGCPLPFCEALSIRTGAIPFKIIFPLKSYELLKALHLNRRKRLAFTRGVSSLVVDKTMNLLVVVCAVLIGLTFSDTGLPWFLFAALFLIMALLLFSSRFLALVTGPVKRFHPRLNAVTDNLVSGFREISFQEKQLLIFYSLLYQSSEFINTFLLLKAVGVTVPMTALLVFIPVIMVITNLPITILGLGTREAAIVFFFAAHGSAAVLLSGSILISLVEHLLPVITGIFFIRSFYMLFMMKEAVGLTVHDDYTHTRDKA